MDTCQHDVKEEHTHGVVLGLPIPSPSGAQVGSGPHPVWSCREGLRRLPRYRESEGTCCICATQQWLPQRSCDEKLASTITLTMAWTITRVYLLNSPIGDHLKDIGPTRCLHVLLTTAHIVAELVWLKDYTLQHGLVWSSEPLAAYVSTWNLAKLVGP